MDSMPAPRVNQVKIALGQNMNRNERTVSLAKASTVAKTGAIKRPIVESVQSVELKRKRNQEIQEKESPRCLTGDVGQICKFRKTFPGLNTFYEVFAKVFKVVGSEDRRKILLIKNIDNSGHVLQAIFDEIDVKMVQLQPGDKVRCVGKFAGNDRRLTVFKVSRCVDANDETPYVRRLNLIGSFGLKNSPK